MMQLSKFSIASKKYWSTAQQKSDKCKNAMCLPVSLEGSVLKVWVSGHGKMQRVVEHELNETNKIACRHQRA